MIRCILFISVYISALNVLSAQTIEFSDTIFLNRLIALEVDTNNSMSIEVSEATAVTSLDLSNSGINSMQEIQYFVNLDSLNCSFNLIDTLIFDSNTALTYLDCTGNELDHLSVSHNILLKELACGLNELLSLDISTLTQLEYLSCFANNLSLLDVSNSTDLISLFVNNNDLTQIDLSNNTLLTELSLSANLISVLDLESNTGLEYLDLKYMTSLLDVCIDNNIPFEEIDIDTTGSPNAEIRYCRVSGNEFPEITNFQPVYINMEEMQLYIHAFTDNDSQQILCIYNPEGKLIITANNTNQTDISHLTPGIYLGQLIRHNQIYPFKFIIR